MAFVEGHEKFDCILLLLEEQGNSLATFTLGHEGRIWFCCRWKLSREKKMYLPHGGLTYGSKLMTGVHPPFIIASGNTEEKVLHVEPSTERVFRL